MPEFVNNLSSLGLDGEYFMETPAPLVAAAVPTGAIGLVGTFQRGPINVSTRCNSYNDVVRTFGEVDSSFTLNGTVEARNIFAQGPTTVYVVRTESAANAAKSATAVIQDDVTPTAGTIMTLNAMTPGTWANSMTATVSVGSVTGTFKVQLNYGSESETWDNLTTGTPTAGQVSAQSVFGTSATSPGKSKLAYGTFPTTADTTAVNPATLAFSGGDNGTTGIVDADYVGSNTNGVKTGLFALDNAPVNYVMIAAGSSSAINTGLVQNAQRITQDGGLPRKAVVTFPAATDLTTTAMQTLVAALNTDRAFPCFLQQQIYDPVSGLNQIVSPLGFYAGLLAQLNPWEVPGNKALKGTNGVDPTVNVGPGDVANLNAAQVAAIGVPTPAGPLGVMGEFTASQAGDETTLTYVRNMKDFIDESVYVQSGPYVDKPITDSLMRQVAQTVDMVLSPLKTPAHKEDQAIADYKIQCDHGNNPDSSLQNNMLICDYAVKLLNINRWLVFRTQIGSGVVIKSSQG